MIFQLRLNGSRSSVDANCIETRIPLPSAEASVRPKLLVSRDPHRKVSASSRRGDRRRQPHHHAERRRPQGRRQPQSGIVLADSERIHLLEVACNHRKGCRFRPPLDRKNGLHAGLRARIHGETPARLRRNRQHSSPRQHLSRRGCLVETDRLQRRLSAVRADAASSSRA